MYTVVLILFDLSIQHNDVFGNGTPERASIHKIVDTMIVELSIGVHVGETLLPIHPQPHNAGTEASCHLIATRREHNCTHQIACRALPHCRQTLYHAPIISFHLRLSSLLARNCLETRWCTDI